MRVYDFNRTKILATLGPATNSLDKVRALIRAGADCFRLNFSHADGPAMRPVIDMIREASRMEDVDIPILADIQGPKLRIGRMPKEGVLLREGEEYLLTQRPLELGNEKEAYSPYEFLAKDVRPGARVLLADGSLELRCERVEGLDVFCRIVNGGRLYSNKGINLPGAALSVETLTDKDRRDLAWLSETDVDMVAISFVRRGDDMRLARSLLGKRRAVMVAKLERPEALERLDEILDASDGVMVARGDLGVELPFEKVPAMQRRILRRAAEKGVWAVVATQMLGSMVLNSRPSRAEVSDVANAVLEGADAVMLSEETATGEHPVQAVEAMVRIAREAEAVAMAPVPGAIPVGNFASAAAGAAVQAAQQLGARAVVTLSGSGLTALMVAKQRPPMPILALSTEPATRRRFNALWGVVPVPIEDRVDMERQLAVADDFLVREGWARAGDPLVVAAALPLGDRKQTNTIRFHTVRG